MAGVCGKSFNKIIGHEEETQANNQIDYETRRLMALRKEILDDNKKVREKIRKKFHNSIAADHPILGVQVSGPILGITDKKQICTDISSFGHGNRRQTLSSVLDEKEEKKILWRYRPKNKAEQLRESLRTLKLNHKDDDNSKVKTAFNTLLMVVKNIVTNPDAEKFRKISVSNVAFQDRVGKLRGGMEFMKVLGFKKGEGGEFLFLPREKVDMSVFNSAELELNNVINNPFFGVI